MLLLVGATATACSDQTEPDDRVTITVETANWNGWDEDDQGEVETTTVEVAALVESADGAIDVDAAADEFTLTSGGPLELMTPTMDAGTTITLTLG